MADVRPFLRSQLSKLVPFFIFDVLYFLLVSDPHGELWTTILKCAPTVCLMLYVFLNGINFKEEYKYSRLILWGLLFSCAGDALLNIGHFPHGMGSFALAQIFYTIAFGFKPLKLLIAIPLYLAGAVFVVMAFKNLDDILVVGVPVYVFLLLTMCWRCLARAAGEKNFLYMFCALGSVLFLISDAIIGVDMFIMKLPNARMWVMCLYYMAQYAIVLSTANDGIRIILNRGLRANRYLKTE